MMPQVENSQRNNICDSLPISLFLIGSLPLHICHFLHKCKKSESLSIVNKKPLGLHLPRGQLWGKRKSSKERINLTPRPSVSIAQL
jgi:hypothetical protein